ncbi:unnamed protein product [Parajaminaea phylloscopi]
MPPKRYFEQAQEGKESSASGADSQPPASSSTAGKNTTTTTTTTTSKANTTLFISRLPFSATTTDLQTLFSDVGPLRRAFVVTDPDTKTSKGVGYVTFSVPEDAERALDQLQGRKLDGKRAMVITWADAKPARPPKGAAAAAGAAIESDGPVQKRPRVAAPAKQRSTLPAPADKDPDAVRTVILTGLAACKPPADAKTLYKRARKIGDVDNILYPLPAGTSHADDQDAAHVIFRTPNHAATAVSKLHAHVFKGALLSAVLKKRADGAAKLAARMRPETKEKMEKLRQEVAETSKAAATLPPLDSLPVAGINQDSRLIIRNLPFDVDASDLRAVFLPFGPIYKIDIPQKAAEPKRARGGEQGEGEGEGGGAEVDADADAVASEAKSSSAAAAATPAIRTKGRGFGFVWLVSRADAARALEGVNGRAIRHGEAEKVAAKAAKGSKGRQIAQKQLKDVRDDAQPERIVAVDWALSKTEWKKKEEEEGEEDKEGEGEGEGEKDAEVDGADSDADGSGSQSADSDEEAQKPALPTPSEGTTLFVRNLPYEAAETELLGLFKQFGPVRYARITMDRSTDPPRSKGTGFVCFWNKDDAVNALKRAREVEEEAGLANSAAAGNKPSASAGPNPFSMTSVLTADPSAPLTASFNIRGRVLNVIPAVEREKADLLTVAGQKARQKQDKRNTYLMREGVPLPATPLAQQLASNEKELERRLASFSQRKSQLAANPSLFISKTRLSVRQLPLFCTDRTLKRLAIHAIKSFKAEVAAGTRTDLDADEASDRTFSPASKPPKKGERATSIIQAKIVRALDRPDPVTGMGGKSKGFGFLEVRSFTEALKILRWANANRDVGKLLMEWHVEELQDLKKKLEGQPGQKNGGGGGGDKAGADVDDSVATAARLKRVSQRLSELSEGGSGARGLDKAERGGLLFVEFSIENATVVKQRRDRAEQNRKNAERRKARDDGGDDDGDDDDDQGSDGGDEDDEDDEDDDTQGRHRKQKPATWNQSTKGHRGQTDSHVNGRKGAPAPASTIKARRIKEQASDKVVADQQQRGGSSGGGVGNLIGRKRAKKRNAGRA